MFFVKGQKPVRPVAGIYNERLRYFRNILVRRFPSTTPVSQQEFVEFYKGRKRTNYQNAVDSLASRSIEPRDAHVKAFVKAEFINFTSKADPDPRVISPRDPRYNVEVGKYLRPIEHRLYAAIGRMFDGPTVLKGYNAKEMGLIFQRKWSSFRDPVAVGLDASRFDQHVSVEALKWEHSVYNGIFKSDELRKLLKWQLKNKVYGHCKDGKLKYTVDGCRMSGDMNTALGNCLIMCALVHCYLKERCIVGSLANNGDDCVVIIESKDLAKFSAGLDEWFKEMGFIMKVEEPVYELEKIEFCQTHPVYNGETYVMTRNYPTSLAKDGLSLKTLTSDNVLKSWTDAVGMGGQALSSGIPVYQSFYGAFLRASSSIVPKITKQNSLRRKRKHEVELEGGLAWLSARMERKIRPISDAARFSFYLAFGTTPDQQITLEHYFDEYNFSLQHKQLAASERLPNWFV